ncbi:MAG: hypothetical protein AAGF01_17535 [Cyanobacteria bacterium P01_G01_bin.38]
MLAPALFLQWPLAIVALPCSIWLEGWFRYGVALPASRRQRLRTALWMNLLSVFIGIPVIYLIGIALVIVAPLQITGTKAPLPEWIIGIYVGMDTPAATFGLFVLWLIPTLAISLLFELYVAYRCLQPAPLSVIWRWVLGCNLISHGIGAIMLAIVWVIRLW